MTPETRQSVITMTTERRQRFRYCCKLKAVRTGEEIVAFKPSRLARVVNISCGGIALHMSESFAVGTFLTIRLYTALDQPISPEMEIQVAHRSHEPNGTWIMGAAFTKDLTEAELQTYLK
jgi:hypothetical protein